MVSMSFIIRPFRSLIMKRSGIPVLHRQLVRSFRSTSRQLEGAPKVISTAKPVGAFRGGFLGFLLGTSLGAYGSYFYLYNDYRRSNDILSEDLYALQVAVSRLSSYVTLLEEKVDNLSKRK